MFYIYEVYDSLNKMYYIGQRDCKDRDPSTDSYMGSSQLMHEGGWKGGRYFEPIFANIDSDKYLTKKILYLAGGAGAANVLEIFTIEDYRLKYGKENIYNISDGGHGRGYLGEEVCKLISSGQKNYWASLTEKEYKEKCKQQKERLASKETRNKMSSSAKARGMSDNCIYRDKTGPNNPMYGKKHSKKSKQIMSKIKLQKIKDSEIYGAKGRKWYHNNDTNESNYFSKLDIIPPGWVPGRGKLTITITDKVLLAGYKKCKKIRCVETNEEWPSLGEFAKFLGKSTSFCSGIVSKKILYNGKHYAYVANL
jgi:hypothetical protein